MNPEQLKYERLWRDHVQYRTVAPGEHLADHFIALARPQPHHSVMDFGCGTGRGAYRIAKRTGASVFGVDFVDPMVAVDADVMRDRPENLRFCQHDLTKPLPDGKPADFGFCTDVLEHVPTPDVELVLANIVKAARRVYFCISTVDDVMGALIGEPLHLTVRPAAWWREMLETRLHCKVMHEQITDNAVIFYVSAWATFDDFEHRVRLNVDAGKFRANVKRNLDLGLPEIVPHAPNDAEIIFLAGGPSLNDHADEIRAMHKRANGTPIVTVNGAYNWAVQQGFAPGLQIIVDAREFNRRFVEPVLPQCKYAVSSQCDPGLVATLPKDRTLLWHSAGDELHEVLTEYDQERGVAREYFPVSGGTTVSLRALPLLAMLGFRRINVYGLDSCIRGKAHHAYPQTENDEDAIVPIEVSGRRFLCAPWMLKQAREFQDVVRLILDPAGVELAVHGDGLIAAILEAAAASSDDIE